MMIAFNSDSKAVVLGSHMSGEIRVREAENIMEGVA